jgi:YD repeat-containing protein
LREPGGRFTSSYDAAGRLAALANPQGKRTTNSYDAAGRLTQQRLGNGGLRPADRVLDGCGLIPLKGGHHHGLRQSA